MRRKAFTLVELLVVVAVIAILISLLLPAINRFRVQAQSTECLTNQRNLIHRAYTQYSIDRNGRFLVRYLSTLCEADTRGANLNGFLLPEDWLDLILGLEMNLWYLAYDWMQTVKWAAQSEDAGLDSRNGRGELGPRNGDDANPNTEYLKAFTNGSLWDYIGDFDVYSSPQDPRLINDPETYRTSQLFILGVCWQRGVLCETAATGLLCLLPPTVILNSEIHPTTFPHCVKQTHAEQTSMAFSSRKTGWILILTHANTLSTGIDEPVVWNPGRWNVSFIDGSVTSYQLKMSEETAETQFFVEEPDGPYKTFLSNTACEDADWLSSKLQPKMLPSR